MFKFFSIYTSRIVFYWILLAAVLIGLYTQWKEIYNYGTRLPYVRINKHTSKVWEEQLPVLSRDQCPPPEQPGRWRMVSKSCYVFSAYIDSRPKPKVVRIIGVNAVNGRGPDRCHLFFTGDSTPEVIALEVKQDKRAWNLRLSPYIFTCPIPAHRTEHPCAVKLSNQSRTQMGLLPIYKPKSTVKKNFTVCVPTLYGYGNTHQLLEMIEANRLFGADNFIIYKSSSTTQVDQYLSYYIKNNMLTVVPWNIPSAVGRGLHYHGQLVTIQDCYYRSREEYNFVVFLDLDEVIVPRIASSWSEMIRAVPKGNLTQGAYMFRSKHFCLNEATQGLSTQVQQQARKLGIDILLRRVWKKIFPIKIRSKMIVSSESAISVGIHFISNFMPGHGELLVDINVGLLHHYRLKPFKEANCLSNPVLDNYMDKFATKLIAHVKKVDELINK